MDQIQHKFIDVARGLKLHLAEIGCGHNPIQSIMFTQPSLLLLFSLFCTCQIGLILFFFFRSSCGRVSARVSRDMVHVAAPDDGCSKCRFPSDRAWLQRVRALWPTARTSKGFIHWSSNWPAWNSWCPPTTQGIVLLSTTKYSIW